jgi:hypothetical protein
MLSSISEFAAIVDHRWRVCGHHRPGSRRGTLPPAPYPAFRIETSVTI